MNTTIRERRDKLAKDLQALQSTCLKEQGHDFKFNDIHSIGRGKGGNEKDVLINLAFSCIDCDLEVNLTLRSFGNHRRISDNELGSYAKTIVEKMQKKADDHNLAMHPFQRDVLPYQVVRESLSPFFDTRQESGSITKANERIKMAVRKERIQAHKIAMSELK